VNQQNPLIDAPNNQVLAAPLERGDASSGESGRNEVGIVRSRETRVVDGRMLDHRTNEHRLQVAPYGLDLR
jgi:hypothetical protein